MGIDYISAHQNISFENKTININTLQSMLHINGHYTERNTLMPINQGDNGHYLF